MDRTTFFLLSAMYIYGFALMIWAIFYDKNPTKKSLKASKIGIIGLHRHSYLFFLRSNIPSNSLTI